MTGPRSEPPIPIFTTFRTRFPRLPLPFAAPEALGEYGHAVEHTMDLPYDIDPIHNERGLARHPKRNMQDCPVLREVDSIPSEHRLDPLSETALLSECNQQSDRLVSDAVLRVVEVEARAIGRQTLSSRLIIFEELSKMD